MKKSIWIILTVIALMIFISRIDNIGMESSEKISAPNNMNISIEGSWKVEKYKSIDNTEEKRKQLEEWIGKTVEINEKIIVFGNEVCNNPRFKVKNVDTKYYFLYSHKLNVKEMGVENPNIDVISVTSSDKPFYDFIKMDENHLMVSIDNGFLFLNKTSDKTQSLAKYENIIEVRNNEKNNKYSSINPSGILLGMRYYSNGKPFYRTLWIAADNMALHPILEMKDLIVPRKNGFWMVESDRVNKDGFVSDVLKAYPIVKRSDENHNNVYNNNTNSNMFRNILFVGNDYIGIEYGQNEDVKNININKLQVLPIDNIGKGKNIKISEVTGEEGKTALVNSANAYILSQNEKDDENIKKSPNEEEFTLVRKNGHWIMQGRLNYVNTLNEDVFKDFNINLIPPSKIINYDKLYVSWNVVKSKVPEAIDAYTSPNKNLALVICENHIYIYGLKNSTLSEKPIKSIKMNVNESIVMAEWATNDYVQKWEKSIKSNVQQIIK